MVIFWIAAGFVGWSLMATLVWSIAVRFGLPEDDDLGTFLFGVLWPVGAMVLTLFAVGAALYQIGFVGKDE